MDGKDKRLYMDGKDKRRALRQRMTRPRKHRVLAAGLMVRPGGPAWHYLDGQTVARGAK